MPPLLSCLVCQAPQVSTPAAWEGSRVRLGTACRQPLQCPRGAGTYSSSSSKQGVAGKHLRSALWAMLVAVQWGNSFALPRCAEGQDSAMVIPVNQSKVTSALWWHYDDGILSAHEDGTIATWDVKSGMQLSQVKGHNLTINDLQYSKDQSFFVTASKDTTAKLFDADTLEHLKTYKTERPVNSAAISPIREHVVLGGGQEAMDVTTSSVKAGKFDARFFHLIFEDEFGKVKDHFGPINSVAFHPDGKSYSSGGEDGYVRVHYFDPSYFEFQVEF